MSRPSAEVCPLCGFDNCETIVAKQAIDRSSAPDDKMILTGASDQSQQIKAASKLLAQSKSPLICGLNQLESSAQIAAWRLADKVHAIVDVSLVNSSHAATQALQRYGKVSATYGVIRNRSDLLVFWDCDLRPNHACLLRMLNSNRVPNRKIVHVGSSDSTIAEVADLVFDVDLGENRNPMARLICRLRAMLAGRSLPNDNYVQRDLSKEKVEALIATLRQATYGSLFYKSRPLDWEFDLETESLLNFVSEFNAVSPLVCVKVRDDANALGAETVMTLASGFPSAISLQRGKAVSSGTLYSASEVLRRSGCDCVLLCGNTDCELNPVPGWTKDKLEQLTVIQLATRPESFADLFIACPMVEFGRAFSGNVFRGDGVMLSSPIPNITQSAETVLKSLVVAN